VITVATSDVCLPDRIHGHWAGGGGEATRGVPALLGQAVAAASREKQRSCRTALA
jgi:hypothetical protein